MNFPVWPTFIAGIVCLFLLNMYPFFNTCLFTVASAACLCVTAKRHGLNARNRWDFVLFLAAAVLGMASLLPAWRAQSRWQEHVNNHIESMIRYYGQADDQPAGSEARQKAPEIEQLDNH